MFKLLDGSQTLGRGRMFWSCFVAVLAAALIASATGLVVSVESFRRDPSAAAGTGG